MTDAMASMPATPELLAAVDALPPANDVPNVDEDAARAADPHFTLKKLIRPLVKPLLVAFVLVALDALATLALPVLIRTGVDNGVDAHAYHVIWIGLARSRSRSCWPTGSSTGSRPGSRRRPASGSSTRCGSRRSRTCSGSAWTTTRGRCPAGS